MPAQQFAGMRVASLGRVAIATSLADRFCIDTATAVAKLTEDPPFGGLWCDQPALFCLLDLQQRLRSRTTRLFSVSPTG